MSLRVLLWSVVALVVAGLAGFGGWLLTLPGAAVPYAPSLVSEAESRATLAALQPPQGKRPLVAIIGGNNGTRTQTTDYLLPYGILQRADVADVVALGTADGPVKLFPALHVLPQSTALRFDEDHPQGANYVLVPAMTRDDDPEVLRWLQQQARKGAIVIGICAGVKVVAAAGLVQHKGVSLHWCSLASLLTLVEAIGGPDRAESVARELGVANRDVRHAGSASAITRSIALARLVNKHASWRHEMLGIEIAPGVDEVALALVADAWSRTYRSRALTIGTSPGTIATRGGLRILPDFFSGEATAPAQRVKSVAALPAMRALDAALADIETRYGKATANLVVMQIGSSRD